MMKSDYRYDVQGLRAIGALLIASFHIWGNAVSGGVDVFFVVSGYFLGRNFLSAQSKGNSFRPIDHFTRFVNRTVPEALLVLATCFLALILLWPPTAWLLNVKHIAMSALYLENFWLISQSVNYLAQNEPPSLTQHFWAVAIIAQVYLSWVFVVLAGRLVASRLGSQVGVIRVILGVLASASFIWGLYRTLIEPAPAYFDPLGRYWEFAVGALLGLGMTRPVRGQGALAWLGLVLILSCGFLVGGRFAFPGVVALWPVAGAVLILWAGGGTTGPTRLLSVAPLIWLGNISFGIYLWHWPIYLTAERARH